MKRDVDLGPPIDHMIRWGAMAPVLHRLVPVGTFTHRQFELASGVSPKKALKLRPVMEELSLIDVEGDETGVARTLQIKPTKLGRKVGGLFTAANTLMEKAGVPPPSVTNFSDIQD